MLHDQTISFTWETDEFTFKEKRRDWYWIVGAVALAFIVVAIIMHNYLFAFLIGIAAFLVIMTASRQPIVSDKGIKVYDDMHNYDSIFAFWITYNKKDEPVLLLLTSQRISPIVSIVIGDEIDPMELREYLLKFVEEQEMQASLTDRIIDRIGF